MVAQAVGVPHDGPSPMINATAFCVLIAVLLADVPVLAQVPTGAGSRRGDRVVALARMA